MNESQWLSSSDPSAMLAHVNGKLSDRKARLFAVACCRQVWESLTDDRSRRAIEIAEKYADGDATAENIQTGTWLSQRIYEGVRYAASERILRLVRLVGGVIHRPENPIGLHLRDADPGPSDSVAFTTQAAILRDIIGNPWRPVIWGDGSWKYVASPWLLNEKVVRIATTIYESSDFSTLPILADALEDSGCDNSDLLSHCRSGGVHVRGCFAIDLILGKV